MRNVLIEFLRVTDYGDAFIEELAERMNKFDLYFAEQNKFYCEYTFQLKGALFYFRYSNFN